MLGRKDYRPEEIERGRVAIGQQIAAYKKLSKAIEAGSDVTARRALEAFALPLFNNLLLALDRPFVHRLRMVTGKDGNALNEVELLCESLLNNGGIFRGNNVIKYDAEASVVNIVPGESISLTVGHFERLSKAFHADLEAKFRHVAKRHA